MDWTDNRKGNDYYWKSLQTENEYAQSYNELTEKKGALTVISVLSNNRIELQRECDLLTQEINDEVERIKGSTKPDDEENPQQDIAFRKVKLTLNHTFPALDFYRVYESDKREIKSLVIDCLKLKRGQTNTNWIEERIDKMYSNKEQLESLLLHKNAIESVINRVLSEEYPETLKSVMAEEEQSNRGRPMDESADQEKIQKRVKELVEKGYNEEDGYSKYWHHEGSHKGQPNKRQIKERLIEDGLTGQLGDSAIKKRIDKALSEIGTN